MTSIGRLVKFGLSLVLLPVVLVLAACTQATPMPTPTSTSTFEDLTVAPPPRTSEFAERYPDVEAVIIGRVVEKTHETVEPSPTGGVGCPCTDRLGLWAVEVERYLVNPQPYERITFKVIEETTREDGSQAARWGSQPPPLREGDRAVFFLERRISSLYPLLTGDTYGGFDVVRRIEDGRVDAARYGGIHFAEWLPLEEYAESIVAMTRPGGRVPAATTRFGFDLLHELVDEAPGDNVFMSPLSVFLALAMTYNGAAGTTQAAMAEALRLGELDRDLLNEGSAELILALHGRAPELELSIANSLWARQDVEFLGEFLDSNRSYFGAEVRSVPFDQATVDAINRWVSDKTEGKIDSIIDELDPNDVMVLLNAVYFKGAWEFPFNEERTEEQAFHLAGGAETRVPMMRQHRRFQYLRGDGFQAVELPYNGGASMVVFLPDRQSSLEQFLGTLDPERWDMWMDGFQEAGGEIALPRFKLEFEAVLNEALSDMGMEEAFGAADFTAMSPANPAIREVRHKAVVDVNEVGTEAAAVTSVGMVQSAPPLTVDFVVDRPFFFAIRDDDTETLLFVGAVYEPGT